MIEYLVHVNIVVSDIERSVRFYEDVLGAQTVRRWEGESETAGLALGLTSTPQKVRWIAHLLRWGGGDVNTYPQIDLLQWIDPPVVGRPYASVANLGIPRICVASNEIEEAYERLRSLGADLISEPLPMNPGTKRGSATKVFCVRDPDGTVIEFIGPLSSAG